MPSKPPSIFQRNLFIYLSLAFMAFAVIGTLSHEGGHWLLLRYFGYKDATINYISTSYGSVRGSIQPEIMDIWKHNHEAIETGMPFPQQDRYNFLMKESKKQSELVTLGGPLQTMLTGTIAFILLLFYQKRYKQATILSACQWLLILLALFWMRQLFNLTSGLLKLAVDGSVGTHSDEVKLSLAFGWPPLALYYITGGIAAIVLGVIFFKFIPIRARFTFILASLFGGIGGSILWLYVIGPVVMP